VNRSGYHLKAELWQPLYRRKHYQLCNVAELVLTQVVTQQQHQQQQHNNNELKIVIEIVLM